MTLATLILNYGPWFVVCAEKGFICASSINGEQTELTYTSNLEETFWFASAQEARTAVEQHLDKISYSLLVVYENRGELV